jgi:UDP-N-acetyl-D-mannosaminuronic acid dehydrogenase
MKKVCILGQGYIGLPTALMFANHGVKVVGVDVNKSVIQTLSSGGLHIEEPGLEEFFAQALQSGNLSFSLSVEEADAFLITVPTPFFHDSLGEYQGQSFKKADMRFVISAAEMILPHLKPGNIVVLESTSPPRTTVELVQPILERSGLRAGLDFSLVYCPERVLPGQILNELVENARVVGGITHASAEAGRDLYASFVTGEIYLTDATTAEMVKLMENTYRDVNIAIANEFSRLADRFGVDVWEAVSLANRHPRVKILNPGPGVGGHCISVDPWFFVEGAPDLASLIFTARKVNDAQPQFVVDLAQRQLGELKGKRIAALGLSYKPDVDDFRESPALEVVQKLQELGCEVRAFDPFAKALVVPGLNLAATLAEAVNGADLLILLVDHAQFKTLLPQTCAGMRTKKVLDTRHCLDKASWQQAGFELTLLGGKS